MLPAQYAWFEPVLIASVVMFVISWIGNMLIFNNRFLNALATAVVFAGVFGAITYYGYGGVRMTVKPMPDATAPATKR